MVRPVVLSHTEISLLGRLVLLALVIEVSLVVEELPLTIVGVLIFEVPLPVGPSLVMIARVPLNMVHISQVVEAI